jgi:hypothetical protein
MTPTTQDDDTVEIKTTNFAEIRVDPLFDEGWNVKKGMIGFVHSLDQDDGKIAVDFNAALGGRAEKGTS